MNVIFITTEWPTETRPYDTPFLVQYVHALKAAGILVNVFHFQSARNPINYLKAWVNIRELPAWKDADILHAHWGHSGLLGLLSRKPLVVTFHGSDLQGIVNQNGQYTLWGRFLVILSKWIAKRAKQVIVVSEKLRSFLPPGIINVEVVPMGVDLSVFKPLDPSACRRNLGLDLRNRYILFTSDPTRSEKRYDIARLAVDLLANSGINPNVELLLVNNQPHGSMPQYLNAGDVLLLTSSHEGSPVIIKEALACNLPIVSVDVGDIKERLQGIEGCYVCPDDRVETIAYYLGLAIDQRNCVNGLAAIQDLDWKTIAQKTIMIYERCLG